MLWFLRLFGAFREIEARALHAERASEDYADEAHDWQIKYEAAVESERRMYEETVHQAKRREDWWAINARLAPIHFDMPERTSTQPPLPNMVPVPMKRQAREVQNEAFQQAMHDLERDLMSNNER